MHYVLKIKKQTVILITTAVLSLNTFAATTTANPKATVKINSFCSIKANPVNFGVAQWSDSIGNNGASTVVSANMTVLCSNKMAYTINGQPYQNDLFNNYYGAQFLTGGNNEKLVYWIYSDAARTRWFADGSSYRWGSAGSIDKTFNITSNGLGVEYNHPLYFTLIHMSTYPKKSVTPGTYTGNYTVTLTY